MKLYSHPASPNCVAVLATAAHLGIALETEFVDLLKGAQHEPAFLAINPNGTVPVLQDGDFILWESSAIMQLLAASKPGNTLWPDDKRTRADIARWQFWSTAQWIPAIQPYIFENLFKKIKGSGEPDAAVLEKAEAGFSRYARVLDRHLTGRSHLVGSSVTLADLSVGSYLMYAQAARLPWEGYSNIQRWFASIEVLPAWRAVRAPAQAAQ